MTQSKRLSFVLFLNIVMITGLVIVGLSSHSLGVLAAGGDYIADSAAIALGLLAIKLRGDAHGPSRATTVVAAINVSFLLVVTSFVIVEAVHRLTSSTPHILGLQALIISGVATITMVIGALVLAGDKAYKDLHMRSVFIDTVSDAASAATVAATGGIIYITKGLYWLDSAAALIISVVVGFTALKLMRDVIRTSRHAT